MRLGRGESEEVGVLGRADGARDPLAERNAIGGKQIVVGLALLRLDGDVSRRRRLEGLERLRLAHGDDLFVEGARDLLGGRHLAGDLLLDLRWRRRWGGIGRNRTRRDPFLDGLAHQVGDVREPRLVSAC